MKFLREMMVVALLAPWGAAVAVPIADGDDYIWEVTSTTVELEVLRVSGAINGGGNLQFGRSLLGGGGFLSIFDSVISAGDMFSSSGSPGFQFLWALANVGTGFGGPYTLYSDSALNPAGNWGPAGLDAFRATRVAWNVYDVEFEDLFLPIGVRESIGDILVRVTGVRPTAVPEPGTLALLGLGLVGMGLARRRKLN